MDDELDDEAELHEIPRSLVVSGIEGKLAR